MGNPIYNPDDKAGNRVQVIKRVPNIAKIDNELVSAAEREAASA